MTLDRHRCEVRAVLAMRRRDENAAKQYFQAVKTKRGAGAAVKLGSDVKAQWERGNIGEKGDWR